MTQFLFDKITLQVYTCSTYLSLINSTFHDGFLSRGFPFIYTFVSSNMTNSIRIYLDDIKLKPPLTKKQHNLLYFRAVTIIHYGTSFSSESDCGLKS